MQFSSEEKSSSLRTNDHTLTELGESHKSDNYFEILKRLVPGTKKLDEVGVSR